MSNKIMRPNRVEASTEKHFVKCQELLNTAKVPSKLTICYKVIEIAHVSSGTTRGGERERGQSVLGGNF